MANINAFGYALGLSVLVPLRSGLAMFKQNIFDLPKTKRIANVIHCCNPNNFRAGFEMFYFNSLSAAKISC